MKGGSSGASGLTKQCGHADLAVWSPLQQMLLFFLPQKRPLKNPFSLLHFFKHESFLSGAERAQPWPPPPISRAHTAFSSLYGLFPLFFSLSFSDSLNTARSVLRQSLPNAFHRRLPLHPLHLCPPFFSTPDLSPLLFSFRGHWMSGVELTLWKRKQLDYSRC